MPGENLDRMNLAKVARLAGVSISTVSRVISRPALVNPETAERVREIIDKYQFEPNANARGLLKQSAGALGLCLVLDPSEQLHTARRFGSVISSSLQAANDSGQMLIVDCFTGTEGPDRMLSAMKQRSLDGAIFFGDHGLDLDWEPLLSAGYPTVFAERPRVIRRPQRFAQVTLDNFGGGRTAAEFLLGLGHRRLAMITGPMHLLTSRERFAGFRFALEGAGRFDPALVVNCNQPQVEAAYRLMWSQLQGPWAVQRPTAVFAGSDAIAVGVVDAARDAGLRVPEDLSVVGFDNWEFEHYELTTVEGSSSQVARAATSLLIKLISGEEVTSWDRILPCPLVEGRTTAPPAEA